MACHPDFQARIKAAVERGNKKLMNVEKVKVLFATIPFVLRCDLKLGNRC